MFQVRTMSRQNVPTSLMLIFMVVLVLIMTLSLANIVVNNHESTNVSLATINMGDRNNNPQAGESSHANFMIQATKQDNGCRIDLFRIGSVPSAYRFFDKPCGDLRAEDIFDWLDQVVGDSNKWLVQKLRNNMNQIRQLNLMLRRA